LGYLFSRAMKFDQLYLQKGYWNFISYNYENLKEK
jgi:hypothetical protein